MIILQKNVELTCYKTWFSFSKLLAGFQSIQGINFSLGELNEGQRERKANLRPHSEHSTPFHTAQQNSPWFFRITQHSISPFSFNYIWIYWRVRHNGLNCCSVLLLFLSFDERRILSTITKHLHPWTYKTLKHPPTSDLPWLASELPNYKTRYGRL